MKYIYSYTQIKMILRIDMIDKEPMIHFNHFGTFFLLGTGLCITTLCLFSS